MLKSVTEPLYIKAKMTRINTVYWTFTQTIYVHVSCFRPKRSKSIQCTLIQATQNPSSLIGLYFGITYSVLGCSRWNTNIFSIKVLLWVAHKEIKLLLCWWSRMIRHKIFKRLELESHPDWCTLGVNSNFQTSTAPFTWPPLPPSSKLIPFRGSRYPYLPQSVFNRPYMLYFLE